MKKIRPDAEDVVIWRDRGTKAGDMEPGGIKAGDTKAEGTKTGGM